MSIEDTAEPATTDETITQSDDAPASTETVVEDEGTDLDDGGTEV